MEKTNIFTSLFQGPSSETKYNNVKSSNYCNAYGPITHLKHIWYKDILMVHLKMIQTQRTT